MLSGKNLSKLTDYPDGVLIIEFFTYFYKHLAPNGAVLVPSGLSIYRKTDIPAKQAPAGRNVCQVPFRLRLIIFNKLLSDNNVLI